MEDLVRHLLDFTQAHPDWAVAVMFVTAFGESFAFLSLLFPGTTVLIAAGALIKTGDLSIWPIMVGAVVGAVLGDTVSFWIANVASALVWAPMLLLAGDVIADAGERLIGSEDTLLLLFGGMTLFGILAALWAAFRVARSKS